MPQIDISLFVMVGLAGLGGLVWLIRLEGRVVAHDHQVSDLRVMNEQEHTQIRAGNDQDHEQMREELHYIRMRIDAAVNSRPGSSVNVNR